MHRFPNVRLPYVIIAWKRVGSIANAYAELNLVS